VAVGSRLLLASLPHRIGLIAGSSPPASRPQLRLDLLYRRQAPLQLLRQLLDDLRFPLGYADRSLEVPKRVLDDDFVLRAAEQEPDGWLVVGVA
jgi:hypothetical protein